ncbi:ubiquitin carboxyl-terminal hydrolase 31 isoform X1 [Rhinolophus ferrumequinum]|uniref:ubiquitin carboxyl-terminal hydrolase 31 isoform X1 n=2 Tax=Rhinolophus ferrumequinum TaxID=59479 RepID=UPI00140FF8B9|nr:ubiquitin carboxyl-terminal hydrolase 31 isoform X1 [Rhinolophus ferrumequinum]
MSKVTAPGPGPGPAAAGGKEKRSFSKRLFRSGRAGGGGAGGPGAPGPAAPSSPSSARSVGSFMSRVLKTLSTLSHLSSEGAGPDRGGLRGCFPPGPPAAPAPPPCPPPAAPAPAPAPPACAGDPVPGVAGLRNHGNTCFMNATLQCLSNTELFAEYLALGQYRGGRPDPDPDPDPDPEPPAGRGAGEVTEQLAHLVRALWTLEYTPQHSRDFKSIVSKNALQYRGNSQHDAQEFLLWLLDRVHEDLNHAVLQSGQPPVKPPSEMDMMPEGPSFPVCSTFVQELFQAQYRSSLTCPHCQKQSNTFDPFLCISLPIPLPHTRPLYVTVVYQGKCSHCMRIGVAVPLSGTVARLREAVSMETKIPTDQIVLTEMYYDGFHRSFCDTDDLETVHESDCIFAFETPEIFRPEGILSQRGIHLNSNLNHLKFGLDHHRLSSATQTAAKHGRADVPPARAGDRIVLLVCNRACSGQQGKRFGLPFVLHLEKTVAWDLLQKEILEKMKYFLRPTVCIQVCPFSLRVVSVVGITYLLPQEEQPLCHPTVERALKSCGPGGTAHVKLVVEWDKETKDFLFVSTEDEYIPDAESVRLQKARHQQPQTCTLSQCFQLYTKEERLAPDDAWRCPHCKQLQQGSITLSLWTLPDVLIIHLKRFRQDGDRRMKLENMVKFPLTGLDMTPHVVKRSQSSWSLPSHWSPWRRPYGLGRAPEDYVYDLYAVCNHHGTMQGGHYTAYCKNSVDGLWYCFDDSDVQQLSEDEVCTQTAYILFYQRRTAIPSWSANSSVAGSTSSSLCEHWVSRLPGSKQASVTSAASSRRTSLASLSESVEMTGERSEDDGGFSARPFVRSVQRQSLSSRSSVTSPLAVTESCIRPSWSLSAKLQLRSSSPSRFSGDSPIHSSASTLEKIGEAVDDKVSVSCFGSLRNLSSSFQEPGDSHSRREHRAMGRAPLAVMEGAFKDESDARKLNSSAADTQSKHPAQGDRLPPVSDPFDNNNQIAYVDQSDSVDSSPVKEVKPPSHPGSLPRKPESTAQRAPSSRGASEPDGSSRKGRSVLASQESSLSSPSPSSPVSGNISVKPPRTRSRAESARAGGRHSSPARPRKESSSSAQSPTPSPSPQKPKPASSLTYTASSTTAKKASGPATRGPFPPGKGRTSDRSLSREGSRQSLLSDRASVSSSSKPSSPRVSQARAGEVRGDGRHVRSSSMASLRSPNTSTKAALKRDSKSEEKGLSFFKSALRQKETRRSTDLGKTTLLAKKAGGSSVRSVCRNAGDDTAEKGQQPPGCQQPKASTPAKEQLVSKDPASARHSLLASRKAKGSQLGSGTPSSPAGGPSNEKPSKKLPASMPASARPSQKPQ